MIVIGARLLLYYFCLLLINRELANGSPVTTDAEAMDYLIRFGHAPQPSPGSLMSYETMQHAIKSFQRFAGLNITGEIDGKTMEMMNMARCGNPDVSETEMTKRRKRFALQGSRWPNRDLTYKIINTTPDLRPQQVVNEVKEAFNMWSKNSGLSFTQVSSGSRADIDISFAAGSHGDGNPFDGAGRTLAHAFFPRNGDAHFDEAERWQITSARGGVNFRIVAAHEFGHSLGIGHSDVQGALMAPFYNPRTTGLHQDDIQAIQQLYGAPVERRPEVQPPTRSTTTRSTITTTTRKTTTVLPPVGACNARFDAITDAGNGSIFAFVQNQYWRLNNRGADRGYPQPIQDVWGVPGSIDAAISDSRNTFLFQGEDVYRFTYGRLFSGYPKKISNVFPGIPSNIDAVFQWSGNGKYYFVKGTQYWRFNHYTGRAEDGYPRDLVVWQGLPETIDAAMQWQRRTYFFKDGLYYRFNDTALRVAELQLQPYPRPADEWWLGCVDSTMRLRIEDDGGNGGNNFTGTIFRTILTSLIAVMLTTITHN